jgi:PAS domain S-box-containing protein
VVLVFRDVTEEGRVQRELAATKERLELAMDAADHGFWDWDLSTDSVYYSPRYCTMLGYEPDELPMRKETWLDLLHPEDREPALNTVTQAVSDGKAYDTEFRLRAKDRSWLWIRSRGKVYVADSQGRPQRVVGTHVDVTDRREAELSVLASREQYMLAVNGSRDGIWDWDLRTDSLFLSTRWKEMIGYADHELDNCMGTFTERIHPDDRDRVMGQVERYLKGELEVYRLEFRFRHRDGSYRWILARGEALRDGDGVAYRMAGSHSDITEDRRLQEELARALEEAKQLNDYLEEQTARANSLAAEAEMANVAKSRFLASMSHEIRTPMNGVIGMADLLLDTELSSEQRGFVEVLRTSGESLLGLLNDILDFSKIEAGHLSLEQIGFDLEDVVSAMAGAVAVGIHEKGLEFVCALRPGLPQRLIGDPARLRQILLNLVGNALKFTQSGEIVVTVEPEPASGSTDTETVLRFSVRDTGIGIPVAKQSLLFHRFSQVDPSVSRTYGGTGLGLAICRELAELMGGEIGVESVEGQGSTFWFTARFGLDSGIGASATEDVPGLQALPGLQVLVVDDSESAAAVLVEQLQAWGASPAAVRDGTSALRSLRRAALSGDPWEVLIVDRSMPAMDGWSLIDTVRGTTEYGAPEIVLMTSLGSSSGGNGPGSGGAGIRTLTKPVLPHDLQDSLRSLLTPVSRAMVEARAAEQPATVTDARPWSEQTRILLVEDNLPSQKVAMAILRKLGVQVEVAGNGVEALEALRRQPFDLVFMDMEMPEMGGLEATKRIRDSESGVRNPRIPVVAMTAHAMDGFRDKCMEAGMSDYVAKPVRTPELVRVLEQWLPGADDAGPPAAPDRDVEDVGAGLATVFDADELVERMVDDLDLARDVALGFLEDTPLQFERLEQALAEGDMATVRLVAHGIKGAAANVGAAALREAAATVEHAAASPDPEAAAAGFAVMVECFPVLCEALRGFAEGVA